MTTIALCVHSLAEGVAMGASLYLGQAGHGHSHGDHGAETVEEEGGSSVGLMITLALFMHKAPESAGFGTFIVGMNCPLGRRLAYIAAYSLSSPFTAFIAFAVFAS